MWIRAQIKIEKREKLSETPHVAIFVDCIDGRRLWSCQYGGGGETSHFVRASKLLAEGSAGGGAPMLVCATRRVMNLSR